MCALELTLVGMNSCLVGGNRDAYFKTAFANGSTLFNVVSVLTTFEVIKSIL
ncbi:MAG: hypothetical protein H7Y03_14855 [Chitinophagaceae bacterium]|nr:hypothetical protein [Chitinophagaceae bacterium]